MRMKFERSSGILLHITSLPSAFGIGDLGKGAYDFVDFLAAAGQRFWQVLPLNPTRLATGNSPYSSPSAFAGNTLLLNPPFLYEEGFLQKSDLENPPRFSAEKVDFKKVIPFKKELFDRAFSHFNKAPNERLNFEIFCTENGDWLDDFALYSALSDYYKKSWTDWPTELRHREKNALKKAAQKFEEPIRREKFLQFLFDRQWGNLKKYAHKKGVKIIGDLPYYVSGDSADGWAAARYFKLDKDRRPKFLSGVPPDMFSETGQLWGTPVYDWEALQRDDFSWWTARLRQNLKWVDAVRLDHFRAFSAYWEVSADHDTAENGRWVKTCGEAFFETMQKEFPDLPFIAEDLGEIDQPVYDLRDQFGLPGMNLLQYAFEGEWGEPQFLPHHHRRNSVTYTGTHDNTTTRGWYQNADKKARQNIQNYVGRKLTAATAPEALQRLALMSVSQLAILPLQDVLALGEEALMNRPGTGDGNWEWRVKKSQFSPDVAQRLLELNAAYHRGTAGKSSS